MSDKLQPYLLEVNTNPALFLDTTVQKEVIPPVLNSTLDIALGSFANPNDKELVGKYKDVFQVMVEGENLQEEFLEVYEKFGKRVEKKEQEVKEVLKEDTKEELPKQELPKEPSQ